jgi:hypothetical protein
LAQLVEALHYKPEGRGFDPRWCHWNFSFTQSFWPHYGPWAYWVTYCFATATVVARTGPQLYVLRTLPVLFEVGGMSTKEKKFEAKMCLSFLFSDYERGYSTQYMKTSDPGLTDRKYGSLTTLSVSQAM